jgi:hypothetical protein
MARKSDLRAAQLRKEQPQLGIGEDEEILFGPAVPSFMDFHEGPNWPASFGIEDRDQRQFSAATFQVNRPNPKDTIRSLHLFRKPTLTEILFDNEKFALMHASSMRIEVPFIGGRLLDSTMTLWQELFMDKEYLYKGERFTLSSLDFVTEIYDQRQRHFTMYARTESIDVRGTLWVEREDHKLIIKPL